MCSAKTLENPGKPFFRPSLDRGPFVCHSHRAAHGLTLQSLPPDTSSASSHLHPLDHLEKKNARAFLASETFTKISGVAMQPWTAATPLAVEDVVLALRGASMVSQVGECSVLTALCMDHALIAIFQ